MPALFHQPLRSLQPNISSIGERPKEEGILILRARFLDMLGLGSRRNTTPIHPGLLVVLRLRLVHFRRVKVPAAQSTSCQLP